MVIALFGLGALIEAVGLIVAARGFRKTWHTFRPGDESFWQPVTKRWRRAAQRLSQGVRRLIPWKRSATVLAPAGAAHAHISIGSRARGRVGFGPLPSVLDDPQRFTAEVQRRINEVHAKVQDARDGIEDEADAREAADRQLRTEIAERVAQAEDLSRSVAVGGLREQVLGWSLIALGFLLQAASTLLQNAVGP